MKSSSAMKMLRSANAGQLLIVENMMSGGVPAAIRETIFS